MSELGQKQSIGENGAVKRMVISPETKLIDLLEAHPALEDILIQYSPAFSKLKNPLLRRSIARVATLRQVATIGRIPVAELVSKLRSDLGLEVSEPLPGSEEEKVAEPEWFRESKVVSVLDVDQMLDAGVHPLESIGRILQNSGDADIIKLVSSFTPEPLIVKFRDKGYQIWTRTLADGRTETFIRAKS